MMKQIVHLFSSGIILALVSPFLLLALTVRKLRTRRSQSSVPTICMLSAEHPPFDKRVFQKEAISLSEAGFRVVHVCPSGSEHPRLVDGVELVTYRKKRGWRGRLVALFVLIGKAWKVNADVYHCNEPDSWLIGILISVFKGRKVVFDCHEYYPGQIKRKVPSALRGVAAWCLKYYLQVLGLLTHSIVLAKYSVAKDFSWSSNRQVVVLNTTPLKALDKSKGGAEPDFDAETFRFVHIGVIRRERGSEQMLDAIRILVDRGLRSFRLRIIGEFKDGSENAFFQRAEELGVREYLEHYRWMPFDKAFELVRESHAGLIFFQACLENNVRGMPHKMFDYMLAGLPVIAPKFALDITKVLNEAGGGVLIDTANEIAIADAMESLMQDRFQARQLGRRGQKAVYDQYHWEKDAEKLIQMYRILLGHKPHTGTFQSRKAA